MRNATRCFAACVLAGATVTGQDLYDVTQVKTIEVTAPADWRTQMANNYASKTMIKVQVTVDGKTYTDVGARHRGFSTYRFLPANRTDKRPWKLAFDEFVPDQQCQGYRTLNLNNNIWDPSMMREVLGYEFMRRYLPAPKSCFVKLKVNGQDLGVFTNTQQINKDFLQEHYRDDDGNRYRGERTNSSTSWNDSALTWLGSGLARYQAAYELKTENGPHPPWTRLIQAINVLNNTATAQLPAQVPTVIDVDNALRFIAVANITAWLDSYLGRTCKNFYIYEDPYHGRLLFQPWDLNNGFGGLTDGLGQTGVAQIPPFFRENDARYPRPLFGQLMKVPAWRAAYLAHLRTMLQEFDWNKMGSRIDAMRKFIRPYLQADNLRIYTMQQFDDNLTRSVNVGFVTVPGLQPFFQSRTSYLANHADIVKSAPALAGLAHAPAQPTASDTVFVTARISGTPATAATLYYRVRGPFVETPMFDDGAHGDGQANDGVWGAAIPKQPALAIVQYYVSANSDLSNNGAMSILPATGSYEPRVFRVRGTPTPGPIVISEFLAQNDTVIQDPAGDWDDWIELTNVGTTAVTVSGMYLTDDAFRPTRWQIPPGQSLQPGQSLLIWADNEPNEGPLHANFKLAASGEEIALFASDGKTNLDWIGFGVQQADVTTGRLAGHPGFAVTFPKPTPGTRNEPLPCGYLEYRAADPRSAGFGLAGSVAPRLATTIHYDVSGAPAASGGALYLGLPAALQVPGLGALLLNPIALLRVAPFLTDATGAARVSVALPNIPSLAGVSVHLQSVAGGAAGVVLSNGLTTLVCR